jgi:hypothetical protein
MHLVDDDTGNLPPKPTYNQAYSAKSSASEARNQRRDPIGYFEDTKYINSNERPNSKYQPSWSNAYNVNNDVNNIDLMTNSSAYHQAMMNTEVVN